MKYDEILREAEAEAEEESTAYSDSSEIKSIDLNIKRNKDNIERIKKQIDNFKIRKSQRIETLKKEAEVKRKREKLT